MAITYPYVGGFRVSFGYPSAPVAVDVGSGANRKALAIIGYSGDTPPNKPVPTSLTIGTDTATLSGSVYTSPTVSEKWAAYTCDLTVSGSQTVTPNFNSGLGGSGGAYCILIVAKGDSALTLSNVLSLLEQATGGSGGTISRTVTSVAGAHVILMGCETTAAAPTAVSPATLLTSATTYGWFAKYVATGTSTSMGVTFPSFSGSETFAFMLTEGDTTPPNLSSPVGTATGNTTATVGATTDDATGTMYAVVTTSATQPSVAQIKAGQNAAGTAANWSGSQAISSTGAKTFSATGLSASTTYYAHLVHTDGAANDSARVTSASFTTSGATVYGFDLNSVTYEFRRENDGSLIVSTAVTFWAHHPVSGALVATVAGLSTNASGIVTTKVVDVALALATQYRVNYEFATGEYGVSKLTAS